MVRRSSSPQTILFWASETKELEKLESIRQTMARDASVWVIRPRGSKAITESSVMAAGLSAGLVDVKVVRFSETHSALKFVIRLRDRGPG
ncbi:MAG: hypothetical protein ABR507_12660 [Actinomycetota bacterium]|nr:hypothetical protein [Actinomycetota bacterium]